VNGENHSTVTLKVRKRPKRSARIPAHQPPNAEASKVTVPSSPASALVIPQAAIRVGMISG
jgi:hypothetical protein